MRCCAVNNILLKMTEIIIALTGLIAALLGGGGILFYKQNKRLRAAEAAAMEKDVLTKDLENQKSTNDEWIRIYNETKSELTAAREKINTLQNKLQVAIEIEGQQRLAINDLTWTKCVVNECPHRKPPRDLEEKLKQIESMHNEVVTERTAYDFADVDGDGIPDVQRPIHPHHFRESCED